MRFRPLIALALAAGALLFLAATSTEHGFAAWLLGITGLCIAAGGLFRFRKDRALLGACQTALPTVTHWGQNKGSEDSASYSVEYRFVAVDGREYEGEEASTFEFPQVGETLPISYSRTDPRQNLPLSTFWFYRFTR